MKAENQLSRKLPNFVKNEVHAKLHYKSNRFRLDNSGEILRLKTLCEDTDLGIHFEFTARATPQQNDIVERQFATLWGMVRASLKRAGLNKNKRLKNKLWAKCANMTTQIFNILVDDPSNECPFEKFYRRMPKWRQVSKFRPFGWMRVAKLHNKVTNKMSNRGELGLMIRYSDIHAVGTYRILMRKSEKVIMTRDVKWIDLYYGE